RPANLRGGRVTDRHPVVVGQGGGPVDVGADLVAGDGRAAAQVGLDPAAVAVARDEVAGAGHVAADRVVRGLVDVDAVIPGRQGGVAVLGRADDVADDVVPGGLGADDLDPVEVGRDDVGGPGRSPADGVATGRGSGGAFDPDAVVPVAESGDAVGRGADVVAHDRVVVGRPVDRTDHDAVV